ncbi:RNA-guided endonuclease IscB [Thermoanaerobacter pentosaceus]|uniref:5-methylcytosine-specific restriction endonuclease McrA n=1 Tax=Thermoanaerobacter pentosaceus TaxID=694059 RepID=A0ABT9M2K8_9THEO|nr:RNA-guided endonuclease IscB [Thermoanaerobacter pentosaceus]MDP9750332.1 5-methylcytosine-specific restriction endonuclease McrA [Thermoanaerobacter pentosaceus]
MVYVISKGGKPLMPTKRHGKVRRLLKQGLAKVVRRDPFTIQLLYNTTTYTQLITTGEDIGSKTVGISAITENQELLSMEVELRQDIKKLLLERREYRRSRRYRKRRYRKPRFLNRRRHEGWLAPSLQWRVETHVKLINFVAKILPVSRIVIEIAPFDTHKIVNPDVEGNQYQKGPQKDFYDIREYCLWRAGYKSELSDKKGVLEVHHIIPRSQGGTDNPSNLIVLTAEEHKALHEGKIKIPRSRLEKVKILKDASYAATIGWHIVNRLKQQYDVEITFGSITKAKRIEIGLEKAHRNDAFVIAGGSKDTSRTTEWYFGKFFRRQNRSLHKANPTKGGKRPVNTIKEVYGFRRFDKVEYQDKTEIILGLRSSGYFAIGSLAGEKISSSVKYSKLRLLEKTKTLMFERREERIPLHLTEDGVSCVQQR